PRSPSGRSLLWFYRVSILNTEHDPCQGQCTGIPRMRDRRGAVLLVGPGHLAVVEGLVEHGLLDALLPRHLAQRTAGGGGLLHDHERTVVGDVTGVLRETRAC